MVRKPARRPGPKSQRKPRRPTRRPAARGGAAIRVRMYRVGFGDCFLLSLPIGGGSATTYQHVLVDCGVHARGDIGTLEDVVADVAETTGRKLAIVIATHAHQDHIAGFDKFGSEFCKFDIGEVWLPWTWDPSNPTAKRLRKKQAKAIAQLTMHFDALAASGGDLHADVRNALANLHGNAHAIDLLCSGFGVGATVRYLKAGDAVKVKDGEARKALAGLVARVLGPPTSEEFLAQMDPPASQHYMRLGPGGPSVANALKPFPREWEATDWKPLREADEKYIERTVNTPLDSLAFALDQARNNESLVTLFNWRGHSLLFAGDAQYGNWRGWLEEEDSGAILAGIEFLKVAHHGSLNATPKSALEGMADGNFAAMVSTQSTPWSSIPRVPLMARLSTKTRQKVVRSDWLQVKGAPRPLPKTAPKFQKSLPRGFSEGQLWFDYVIPV